MSKKPIKHLGFILLHGAGYGSWIWEDVVPQLQYPSVAVDLPGREEKKVDKIKSVTLKDYTKAVIADIDASNFEKIILVAHSFSGTLALRIATLMPERIQSLIFLSAAVPQSGKSFISLLPMKQQIFLQIMFKTTFGRPPIAAIKQECKGLSEAKIREVLQKYTTESPHAFLDRVPWSLPHDMPLYYVRDTSDFPQEASINNLYPTKIITLDTGHLPMLSQPDELAQQLNSLTR